jgi:hypothetical protein
MNPLRRKIRQLRNRRRLRNGARRAKGVAGYLGSQVRDAAVQTAGLSVLGLGLSKARGLVPPPKAFKRQQRLATFKKRLSKQHRAKISLSLRSRTNLDQQLKRVETGSKIFRSYAGGVRSLATAKKYTQEIGRGDTVLRRLDRLSAIAGRRKKIFSTSSLARAEFGVRRLRKRIPKRFLNSTALKVAGVGLGLGGTALSLRGVRKDRMANLASDRRVNALRQKFNDRVAEINSTM